MTEPRPESASSPRTMLDNVRQAIAADGRSARKIEEAGGLAHSTVARIASGKTQDVPLATAEALAEALGLSFGALLGLPSAATPQMGDTLPWGALTPNPANPRKTFDEEELRGLAASIEQDGILQNLVVRPQPGGMPGEHQIVAGERRWRAFGLLIQAGKAAKTDPIPVRVVEADDRQVALIMLVENLQRAEVPPLEEAAAFAAYLDSDPEASTQRLADLVGKSRRYVQQRVALIKKTTPEVRQALASGAISVTEARDFTKGPIERQNDVLHRILEHEPGAWGRGPNDITHNLKRGLFDASKARFDLQLYDGGRFADEDGTEYLTELPLVRKLQLGAADSMAKAMEGKRAWVKVVDAANHDQQFQGWRYEKQARATKDTGYVVVVDQHGHLTERDGLLTAQQAEEARKRDARQAAGASEAEAKAKPLHETLSQGQRLVAARARSHALQAAVADAGTELSIAIATIGLVAHWPGTVGIAASYNHETGQDADLVARLSDLLPNGARDDATRLLAWLLDDAERCEEVFRIAVALTLSTGSVQRLGDPPLAVALANASQANVTGRWQVDEDWLKSNTKARLQAVAIDSSAIEPDEMEATEHRLGKADLITAILAAPSREADWTPPEMRFGSQDEIEAATDGQAWTKEEATHD